MKRLIRYSAAGLAQMGTVCCPNCFGQAMPQLPLSGKNWSEHERAEIGRLEAVCSETNHWSLDCDHTDAGDPWCVIYDQQHHRIVLHIARIERRYVVVWPSRGPVCGDAEHDCGGRDGAGAADGLREGVVAGRPNLTR